MHSKSFFAQLMGNSYTNEKRETIPLIGRR